MNYIKEINAFYDLIERKPLSASAVTLWHTLMHINNKAMWIEAFTVAAAVLRLKSGLTESSFKRARTELKDKGYIDFISRDRNQAPIYRMVRLSSDVTGCGAGVVSAGDRDVDGIVDRELDQVMNHLEDEGADRNASTLSKHKQDRNKTKQDKTVVAEDAFVFYQENFGVISPFVSDGLLNWVHDLGEPLVLEAMKRAVERNKLSWGYVKGILQAWAGKGISSVEAAKAEEVAFRNERKGRVDGAQRSAEVVPDWFAEHRRQAALKKSRVDKRGEDLVSDAEVLAMLEKHGSGVLV